MAMPSLVEELAAVLDEHKYMTCVRMLDEATAISQTNYAKVKKLLCKEYSFDTSKFMTHNGKPIASGMYDYFVNLVDYSVEEIHDKLIEYVTDNKEMIDSVVRITLEKRGSDINFW